MVIFMDWLSLNGSRTSHEVRGLKYFNILQQSLTHWSHLTRGAWIEIVFSCFHLLNICSRTSHEVRGLKYFRPVLFCTP